VTYTWPSKLVLPPRPPKLVYLDLNHWIALSKANAGHRDGERYRELLAACTDAVKRKAAVFPLSDSLYFEVSKIPVYRQRRNLREVIERLSGFMVVTSRAVVAVHEIETLLDKRAGPSRNPINETNYLDWGVMRALGKEGSLRFYDVETGDDVTDAARASHPGGPEAFDQFVWEAHIGLNRHVLDGPTQQEESDMRAFGWDPRAAFDVAQNRARQEIEQVARFNADPRWRRGRIRDVIAAREVAIELWQHFAQGLQDRGAMVEDVFPDPADTVRAWDSLPSFDVAVTIKAAYHRDPNHVWRPNDITDIDVLGSTLPYCDIVITDKAVATVASRTGLADRLGTKVLARLSDLPALL
jgi:hypothetical protein